MSCKETEQMKVFEQVRALNLTQVAAAKKLGITDRQVRSKYKRYLSYGVQGLVHRGRGRPSKSKVSEDVKSLILKLLRGDWKGFKPKFVAEQLLERHRVKISRESVRTIMIANGLWKKRKRGTMQFRERRPRKEYFGEMIQLDGSPHDWFEDRGPRCTLLSFIDDATSEIVWLEFAPSESVQSVMIAARKYMERHGRPCSIYTDYGTVFRVVTNNPDHEKKTQWERAQRQLGIEPIHASSPQAKGRVERNHSTNQDRLVWLMRMENISTIDQANAYVQGIYMAQHNAQFAVKAAKEGNMHRSIEGFDFDNIFCLKEVRKIQNDYVISYKTRLFQLKKHQSTIVRPKEEVVIHERFDGSIEIWIRKVKLAFKEIVFRPIKKKPVEAIAKEFRIVKPAANHPWKQYPQIDQKSPKSIQNGGYLG